MDDFLEKYRSLLLSLGFLLFSIILCLVLWTVFMENKPDDLKKDEYVIDRSGGFSLSIPDFQFQPLERQFDAPDIYYMRDPMKAWTPEQVKKYLEPIENILYHKLDRENQGRIDEIFSEVD